VDAVLELVKVKVKVKVKEEELVEQIPIVY
jgi:hypothetical protein